MWQTLKLNTEQFDLFRKELNRITTLIHSADWRNNFILVNLELQQLVLTPTFHIILSEIIPMLRSIDPVTLEQSGHSLTAKGWSFLFGDQQYYIQLQKAMGYNT
jgi:hypothetical protein